jgi:putative glutamine amidotransferase
LFFGGPDLPPSIYKEQSSLLTRMTDPYRHYFETSFLFHLLGGSQNENYIPLLDKNKDYTVYAICLGMQTMNIAAGGTMTQDIPGEIYNFKYVEEVLASDNNNQHRNYNNNLFIDSTLFSGNFHEIKIKNQHPIVTDYKENLAPLVYSNHHQTIEKLGKDILIIATSTDGKIIEAIAHNKYPNVLGLQFHPEGIYLHNPEIKYRKNPNDELKYGMQILSDHGSYLFHLELWKTLSKKIEGSEIIRF